MAHECEEVAQVTMGKPDDQRDVLCWFKEMVAVTELSLSVVQPLSH